MSGGTFSRELMRHVLIGPPLRLATRMRVEGRQHVPPAGPLIVASNHLSFIDSIVIPLACRRQVHFLGKAEYFQGTGLRGSVVRWFHSTAGTIPVDRSDPRAADAIAREELTAAGLDRDIWQCPVVLLADVRSVGVQGDGRTYGHPVVLRPVSSEDAMTADWTRVPYDVLAKISTRITNEVREVNRVVLDVTSKPPGTIEWE